MKKRIIMIMTILFVFLVLGFTMTGGKRTDVVLQDFSLSEDGSKMVLNTSLAGSMGYTRKVKVKQGGDNQYLTFYSTFGLNNKIGAKNKFEITLNPSCEEIYFYQGDKGYQLVLQKNQETKEWEFVK